MRAALLLCGLASLGCIGQRPVPADAYRVWLPAYAFGAFGGGELDVRDYCPDGAARELSVGSSWGTLGVSLATLGVYTPREVKVRCAGKP